MKYSFKKVNFLLSALPVLRSRLLRRRDALCNRHERLLERRRAMAKSDDAKVISEKAKGYFDQGFN